MFFCRECPSCRLQKKWNPLAENYVLVPPIPIVCRGTIQCTDCGRHYITNRKVIWTRILAYICFSVLLYSLMILAYVCIPGLILMSSVFWTITIRILSVVIPIGLDRAVCARLRWTEATAEQAKREEKVARHKYMPFIVVICVDSTVYFLAILVLSLIVP